MKMRMSYRGVALQLKELKNMEHYGNQREIKFKI